MRWRLAKARLNVLHETLQVLHVLDIRDLIHDEDLRGPLGLEILVGGDGQLYDDHVSPGLKGFVSFVSLDCVDNIVGEIGRAYRIDEFEHHVDCLFFHVITPIGHVETLGDAINPNVEYVEGLGIVIVDCEKEFVRNIPI